MIKLKVNEVIEKFATIEFRMFYLRMSYSENQTMKMYKTITL
jgi:hypothetical protein